MNFIYWIVTLLVGVYLGTLIDKKKISRPKKRAPKTDKKKVELGAVKLLSPKELAKRGTRLEEEEKEMKRIIEEKIL